jgi:hypothetical protein
MKFKKGVKFNFYCPFCYRGSFKRSIARKRKIWNKSIYSKDLILKN